MRERGELRDDLRTAARAGLLIGVALALFIARHAIAQSYPNHTVRLIVPYTAGGGTDVLARVIAKGLTVKWNVPVVVDNRPGGDATIGIDLAAHAKPDGYTLAMTVTTHAVQASLKPSLPYDLLRDFSAVTEIAEVPSILLSSTASGLTSVPQLIERAKRDPQKLNFAGTGTGGPAHLAGELFNTLAGIRTTHVPYKGGSQALTDVIGGQVDFMFSTIFAALPAIQGGRVKALAVTTAKRINALPDLPTVAEAGVPGYKFVTWYGVVTRKETPKDVVDKIAADIREALNAPEAAQTLAKEGANVIASTPEDFAAYLNAEVVQWTKVVRQAGIKAE